MKTIYIPKEGKSSVVAIFVPVGSRCEPDNIKGISHVIEHMCFKGTKNRTCRQIAQAIEQYGGQLNAYTDTEVTCYWAHIGNEHLEHAKEVLTDLVTNPIFDGKEFMKEREVILQELNMYQDDPGSAAWDLFNQRYFGRGSTSGLKLPIIGTKRSLRGLNRKHLLKYYQEHYQDPTMVIVGEEVNVAKSDDVKLDMPKYNETLNYVSSPRFITRKDITQAQIIIGNYLPMQYDKVLDSKCLGLLSAIFNDMSGRLFTVIREQHNLVYRVHFNAGSCTEGTIGWTVNLGLDMQNVQKAYELVKEELSRPVTDEEIDLAVQKAMATRLLAEKEGRKK